MSFSHFPILALLLFFTLNRVPLAGATSQPFDREGIHFNHMDKISECQICHQGDNYKLLKLLTGQKITSQDIPQLCGQCHGIMKRDWDAGVHGKHAGSWQVGAGEKWACIKCHESHDPKFKQMKAYQAPQRPKFGIEKGSSHEKK